MDRRLFAISFVVSASIVAACVGDAPGISTTTDDAGSDEGATSGGDGSTGADGGTTGDAGPSSACDLSKPFGAPLAVPGIGPLSSPVRLSNDELTAYFALPTDAGVPGLFQAQRATMSDAFGAPVPLAALNDDAGVSMPSVSQDGLHLVYAHGWATSASLHDIWFASRASVDGGFGAPQKIPAVNLDGIQDDYPSLESNDDLWFVSTRIDAGPGLPNHEIFHAKTAGGISYSSTAVAPNINAPATNQYYPLVTADRLRIYYARDMSLYTATRTDPTADFSDPTAVTEINALYAAEGLRPSWVSVDGCRLYVTVGSPQVAYVAAKPAR